MSSGSEPSLSPAQLLTRFPRASSKLNLFTALFTVNKKCRGGREESWKRAAGLSRLQPKVSPGRGQKVRDRAGGLTMV